MTFSLVTTEMNLDWLAFCEVLVVTLLLEAFNITADTPTDFRYMTWSSIRDTKGVMTRVKPRRNTHM